METRGTTRPPLARIVKSTAQKIRVKDVFELVKQQDKPLNTAGGGEEMNKGCAKDARRKVGPHSLA